MSRLGPGLRLTLQMPCKDLLRRFAAFNVVGAAGVVLQLATLAVLVRVFEWHYLAATAVAVEAAILNNFVWHQRWTWKDRPSATRQTSALRLIRFHALNGAISFAGNLLLMTLFTGALRLDPIAANGIAILACSLVNFAASERLVFRATIPAAALLMVLGMSQAAAAGQSAPTLAAWRSYEAAVDARYEAAPDTGDKFFALDRERVDGWRDIVASRTIRMVKIEPPSIADGKIHHWVGAVFVPGVTVDTLVERLKQNAGRESEFYEDVIASKLLARDGDRLRIFMKLRRTKVITVTYNTEHAVAYRKVGASRASARSVATKIAELQNAGTVKEREKAAGEDSGYLWRLNAYWRYEAVPGGVLVECESVSLSRPVPWYATPIRSIIDGVARDSLERTLRSLRAVLVKPAPTPAR
jgi:putative flippase GtrA